jgi:hypothetical protein
VDARGFRPPARAMSPCSARRSTATPATR